MTILEQLSSNANLSLFKLNLNKMCNYVLVASNSSGTVQWCRDCRLFMVTFNNIDLFFGMSEFDYFKSNVMDSYERNLKIQSDPHSKSIVFSTKMDNVQFRFSLVELRHLLALLQEAVLVHYASFQVYE